MSDCKAESNDIIDIGFKNGDRITLSIRGIEHVSTIYADFVLANTSGILCSRYDAYTKGKFLRSGDKSFFPFTSIINIE